MTTKVRRVREQAKRDREAAIGDYLDSQAEQRRHEHNADLSLEGIVRWEEVYDFPITGGIHRTTITCYGLR